MTQTKDLEDLPIGRLLLKYSLPAITGTVVTSLYNIVDRIFLGRYVGESAIAATTIAMPMMMVVMAFGMLIGFGTNSQISIKLGEKKHEEAEELLGQGILLFLICSLSITVLGLIFLYPLLNFFGATENIMPYAVPYIAIVMLGTLPCQVSFGMNNFIRGEGNPRVAMMTMLIGAICNIVLDYIFIVLMGWGMHGAGLATVLGYSISAAWVLYYFLGGKSLVKFRFSNFKIRYVSLKKVLAMGSPHFVMNLISSFQMSLFNNQLGTYGGDMAISIMGVAISFNFMWIMPIIGVSQGMQPIVGYNYGAKQYQRVKETLILSNIVAVSMCTIAWILVKIFPEHIFGLFTGEIHSEFVLQGAQAIKKLLFALPVVGSLVITANFFQFIGRPRTSLALTMGRQLFFLIPFLVILPRYLGLDGVWYSMPASDVGTLVLTTFFLTRQIKELNKLSVTNN